MATRQHVKTQRERLKAELRAACREHRLRPGDAIPPLRQLCAEFGLARNIVLSALRELCEEGVLHTIERAGTFAGPARPKERPLFAFFNVSPELERHASLKSGFETRVAALGGSVLTLLKEQGEQLLREGRFPDCAGVFEMSLGIAQTLRQFAEQNRELPSPNIRASVVYGESDDFFGAGRDSVAFDDESGGRLATEHLIALGHERIAFLGVHQRAAHRQPERAEPKWSYQRQLGWQGALRRAGLTDESRAFHALSAWQPDRDAEAQVKPTERECVAAFVAQLQSEAGTAQAISAVVVANDHLAAHLFAELHRISWPRDSWPAVVSFDGDARVQNEVVSSLRLPWEKIGGAAAELLWQRSQGITVGPPVHRSVAMQFIPRLSCRPEWDLAALTHQDSALVSSNGLFDRQHNFIR